MNHAKLSEKLKFDAEVLEASSGTSPVSLLYDMRGYQQAMIGFCVQGDFTTVVVDLVESSATTSTGTSAAGGKAGIVVGGVSTLVSVTGGVRKITVSPTSASTNNEGFALSAGTVGPKTFTLTSSTALLSTASTSWTSTLAYFGSTVGTTANTGVQFAMDSLKVAVEQYFPGIFALSTPTTGSLGIALPHPDYAGIGFSSTYATMPIVINQAVGGFNIDADQLTSTANKRYIGIKVATAVTAVDVGVSVIRASARYGPTVFGGKLSS
jgi:hypothetical protein